MNRHFDNFILFYLTIFFASTEQHYENIPDEGKKKK